MIRRTMRASASPGIGELEYSIIWTPEVNRNQAIKQVCKSFELAAAVIEQFELFYWWDKKCKQSKRPTKERKAKVEDPIEDPSTDLDTVYESEAEQRTTDFEMDVETFIFQPRKRSLRQSFVLCRAPTE